MQIHVCKDENDWIRFADSWLFAKVLQYQAKSLYLPAGETPRPLYRQWEIVKPRYFQNLKLIQIDEVVTGSQAGLFKNFFLKELPSFHGNFSFMEKPVEQADLAILGLGMNGHVAFHEPGTPSDFFGGDVSLSSTTIQNLKLEPEAKGITYGLGAFLKTKSVLLLIRGEKKKEILKKVLKGADPLVPASFLIAHPDLTILTDFDL